MHWLIRIYNRAFVRRFYEAHLLAFLFVTLAMFGMADGSTVLYIHYSILQSAFSSPFTLLCLWLVWLLYAANGLRYMLNTLGREEFQFLYISNSLPRVNLLRALTLAVVQINAPVIIYGGAGVVTGLAQKHYLNALLGATGLLLNVVLSVAVVYYQLVNVHRSPLIHPLKLFPTLRFRPGILSILLRHITTDNKMALIGIKLFSCAVIYGAHYEWRSFNYDIRWMQVAMSVAIPAQGILLYQLWSFETTYLSFTRNFPVEIWKRYLSLLAIVLILLIPEAVLLTSYCIRFHILWQLPVYLLYAASLPMLLYALLFTRGFNQESFNSFLFAMALTTFFVTLFGFTWLLALAFVPISFAVYRESFYNFEKTME